MTDWQKLAEIADIFGGFGFSAEFCRYALENFGALISNPILHIGVGNGREARVLADHGHWILGIDSAAEMAAQANHLGILSFVHDARAIPIPNYCFAGTILISTGVLDCVDDSQALDILGALTRLAAPGARLFLNHFNHAPRRALFEELGFLDGERVSSAARYEFWCRMRSGENIDPRGLKFVRIFDLLQEHVTRTGASISDYLEILPTHHYVRDPCQINGFLDQLGWDQPSAEGIYDPGNIFYSIRSWRAELDGTQLRRTRP